MGVKKEIIRLLKESVNVPLKKSVDFEILAQAIKDKTGEGLGTNTLKRICGYKTRQVEPRHSTMDVIARYLGFSDYDNFLMEIGEDADISMFSPIKLIESTQLVKGTRIKVNYEPNREFELEYAEDGRFVVIDIKGSRNIHVGDVMKITQLAIGHRFVAAHVWRDGKDLGVYEAAKENGIAGLTVSK